MQTLSFRGVEKGEGVGGVGPNFINVIYKVLGKRSVQK